MDNLEYDYLMSDFEGVVLIVALVEEEVISCNFAAIKRGMSKRQKVYCPTSKDTYTILLPDEAVEQIVPVSMAGEVILHRVKDDIMSTNT